MDRADDPRAAVEMWMERAAGPINVQGIDDAEPWRAGLHPHEGGQSSQECTWLGPQTPARRWQCQCGGIEARVGEEGRLGKQRFELARDAEYVLFRAESGMRSASPSIPMRSGDIIIRAAVSFAGQACRAASPRQP